MNSVDSDLEEGEIIDDSPFPKLSSQNKKLPRRYNIVEIKNNRHKHKKECKHSIRHHIKKLAKLKQSPVKTKTLNKNHHQSCPQYKNYEKNDYHFLEPSSKDGYSKNSNYHPYVVQNGKYKDNSHNRLNARYNENIHSELDITKTTDSNSFSKIRAKYKALKNRGINHISKAGSKNILVDDTKVIKEKKVCKSIAPKSPEVIIIRSDDEEDLRQVALATCAKQTVPTETAKNLTQSLNCNNVIETVKASPCHQNYVDYNIADNYEVVDMDLDENNESSTETTDSLFIIDTTPSLGFQTDSNSLPKERKVVYCSDDDFEVDILRAQLIEGMYCNNSTKDDLANTVKDISQVPPKICKPHVSPDNLKKNSDNVKTSVARSVTEIETISSPKRLIIALNGESTSEESDTEQDANPSIVENPVASIEALISDIRQKSDSNDKSNNVEVIPKALSCLSKAQQEEYNALTKLLAQKTKVYPIPQEETKSKFVHSPMDDLKVLEAKLMGVQETLKCRSEKMTSLSKEVFTKKQIYMKAKLSAQHLKEQYVLAEKTRRIKLDSWSKSCKNFEAMKKSVSDLESKIVKLQDLCSRVGSCIKGQNYCLPSSNSES